MTSSAAFKLVPLLPALVAAGCAMHVRHDQPPPPGYEYRPPAVADPNFRYTPAGPVSVSALVETTRHHEVLRLSYPSSGNTGHPENVVEGLYFRSLSPGANKVVIVLPVWGSSNYPPSKISYGYAKRSRGDAHVIWLFGDTPIFPWTALATTSSEEQFVERAKNSAERYRTAVIDIRRLIDWTENQPEIDATRIGVVGFSMSALVAATLLGNDARIAAAVLMMGAADFADVFATCQNRAGEVRRHVLSEYGWSLEEYREFFQGLFAPADPLRYRGRYNPDDILMIDTRFDDCMPRRARNALWKVTGHPERITLLYRHRTAFYSLTPLGLNFSRRRIYRFLDDAL